MAKAKGTIAKVLHGHWVHSHEEDTDTEMVFRPASYPFPPARGRTEFELKPGGDLVQIDIGPTDRRETSSGKWKLKKGDELAFYHGPRDDPSQVLKIRSADNDKLILEKSV